MSKRTRVPIPSEPCQCKACLTTGWHASDCAVHSEPAHPASECNCRERGTTDDGRPLCMPCTRDRHADPVRPHYLATGPRCACRCSRSGRRVIPVPTEDDR